MKGNPPTPVSDRNPFSWERRSILRYGGLALAGGLAGCSGGGDNGDTQTERDPGDNVQTERNPENNETTQTPSTTTATGCGPGETEIGSASNSADRITLTGEVSAINSQRGIVFIDDGTAEAAIFPGGTNVGERFSEGDCLTVTGSSSRPLSIDRNVKIKLLAEEVVRPGEEDGNLLEQSLPDPSQYIPSGLSDAERAVGTVRITIKYVNSFRLEGPGDGQVTAIAGYFDGAKLDPNRNWSGKVSQKSGKIYSSASGGDNSFSFDLFDGFALRAVEGVNVIVEGTTVAEGVKLIRYRRDDGVFEQEPVSE